MVWNNCQLIWPYFIFVISEFGFSRPVGLLRTRFCSGCIRNISLFDLMRSAQTFFFALRNRHQSSIVSFFLHHVKCLKLFWGSVKFNHHAKVRPGMPFFWTTKYLQLQEKEKKTSWWLSGKQGKAFFSFLSKQIVLLIWEKLEKMFFLETFNSWAWFLHSLYYVHTSEPAGRSSWPKKLCFQY